MLVLTLTFALIPSVADANVNKNRQQFLEAVEALDAGDVQKFEELSYQNRNYILYPYLKYYDLRKRILTADEKEIIRFIQQYSEFPFSKAILVKWLSHLANENNWQVYLNQYTGQSRADLKCHYLTAALASDLPKKGLNEVLAQGEQLWLSARKDKAECKPIFEALKSYGRITTALRWQRIERAMEAGNLKLATELSTSFGSRDKRLVALWKKVYKKPHKIFTFREFRRNSLVKRKIVFQAIKRVAYRDVEKATKLWRKARKRFPFEKKQKQEMQRYLALQAAYKSDPNALHLLKQVSKKIADPSVQVWRARIALKDQNWKELLNAIKAANPQERNKIKWKYWQARAWEQLGKNRLAKLNFEDIAVETNYYGFLAADRIKKPYKFTSEPLLRDESQLALLRQLPGIQRTQELYAMDRITEARREWNLVISNLDEEQVKLAAIMAHDWQWHDNAILTVARTSHRRDLELRFPTPYRKLIFDAAENYGLDPEWIYGVTRRESAFNVTARSHAGALGLMQILPSTARIQSKSLGLSKPSLSDLLSSDQNILLGSSYLNKMLQRFSGNQVVATAAYNAGPNRVSKWLPKGSKVAADIWVDTIPYKETREYVRAVMAYATIFEWKLKQRITPLAERMEEIIF